LINLKQINQQALTTGSAYLPGFLSYQHSMVTTETLRRYAETVYTSENALTRRNATINALALASESGIPSALDLIHALAAARNNSEKAGDQLHMAELLLRDQTTQLALLTGQDLLPLYPHNATHATSTRERKQFEAYQEHTLQALEPLLKTCQTADPSSAQSSTQLRELCAQTEEQWASIERIWQRRTASNAEARALWRQLDDILIKVGEEASASSESTLAYDSLNDIRARVKRATLPPLPRWALCWRPVCW
jgi:hypothetical protein